MHLPIDQIQNVEFGVSARERTGDEFYHVPVDTGVKALLREMMVTTANALEGDLPPYEFSQAFTDDDRATFALDDPAVNQLKELFDRDNLPFNSEALKASDRIKLYFATFYDAQHRKLMLGIKRAVQFKLVTKSSRLISWIDDTVKVLTQPVFKLDNDFDLVVTADSVMLLRPKVLPFIVDLEEYVIKTSVATIERVSKELPFMNWQPFRDLVQTKKKTASLLTAIGRRPDLPSTSKILLKQQCDAVGVALEDHDGIMTVPSGAEYAFLEVLDRRRYAVTLIENAKEVYEAPNRHLAGAG